MAVLFIWVFVQDKVKNTKLLEDNSKMLQTLVESNQNIAISNSNVAKSLDLITNNLLTIDHKVDRIYEKQIENNQK